MKIDPITTEVIASRLGEIASSMEYALYHSGYSPILRESKDGTAGLTDASGRVVMLSGGLQYHLLSYQQAVEEIKKRYPGAAMRPGDSFIVNDPYLAGNAHVPDLVAVSPAFHADGTLIGFGVSIAHKADMGGIVPGSSGAAAREIFHDGLLLPPVRFQTNAGVEEAVEAIIRNNSRVPDMVLGDIRAQVGCTRLGAERLVSLCNEYSVDTIQSSMDGLIAATAQRLRAELSNWPDSTVDSEGFLDHDGVTLTKRVRIHVRAEKKGNSLTLDFSGCDPQTVGPVNLVSTVAKSASLLAVVATADPSIRINAGVLEAVTFVIPNGRVVSPIRPATVNHYFPAAHLVYSCVLGSLGRMNKARGAAPSGLGCGAASIGFATSRSGKPSVVYELFVTSLGGTTTNDGSAIVHPMSHFTPSTAVEILESEYPIRVKRFDIRIDSAGAGRYRGGIGFVREFEMREDCILTVRSTNHQNASWGVDGGQSPMPSQVILNPDRPDRERLPTIVTRHLKRGDVVRFEQSGGGGYGPPSDREDELVLNDVLNGYVSHEAALNVYSRNVVGTDIVKIKKVS